MKTYIIVGSSAAGLGVLSRLRQLDPTSRIICISSAVERSYNTCLLADFLAGDKQEDDIFLKEDSFFRENRIELFLDTTVLEVDPSSNRIHTTKGEFQYDNLFLGLGTSFFTPPIPGAKDCLSFHTLSDTYNLLKQVDGVKSATVIGGGLSGVECSDALHCRGIKVTILEQRPFLLPGFVDAGGARFIEKAMQEKGVSIRKPCSVKEITQKKVSFDSGEIVSDLIVIATGGRPNVALAKEAGIKVEAGGIVVDEFMQTTVPGIYAGGDCALVKNVLGGKVCSTLWPDAMVQGMHAASAMAGKPKKYPGVLKVGSSNFYDIPFVSCGNIDTVEGEVALRECDNYYHKFLLQDGVLKGFLMVGKIENLGLLRRLAFSGQPISKKELLSNF